MSIRVVLISMAAAAMPVPSDAQPDKDEHAKATGTQSAAPVILASVEDAGRPAPSQDASAERARRPAPRVTTCRCGDPQASQEQPPGRQPDE